MPRWAIRTHAVLPRLLLLLAAAYAGVAFLASPPRATAEARPAQEGNFAARAKRALLMDAATGAILFQTNTAEPFQPANMTKLMTLAVVFRHIKEGRLKLEDEFTMSENAWRTGGAPSRNTAMFVPLNTKVTVGELIQGVAVQYAHDAAICLAEGISGSEKAFAALMEAEAKRIGLTHSVFRNASGLFHPEQVMTVRDLVLLARHLVTEYPDRYPVFAQKEFSYRKHRFTNFNNPFLNAVAGADGLSSGYVRESGYGLVGSAVQEGRRLIGAVSGLESDNERREEARRLFEWGFQNTAEFRLFDAEEIVGTARVWGGDRMFVNLTGKGGITVLLPRAAAGQRLQAEIVYLSPLKAPLAKGDEVAMLRISTPSGAEAETPLYAAEDVGRGGIMRRGLDSLVHMAFKWVLL